MKINFNEVSNREFVLSHWFHFLKNKGCFQTYETEDTEDTSKWKKKKKSLGCSPATELF